MNAYAGNQWVRLLGGVLLAAGAVVLFVREGDRASHAVLMLIALVPAAVLYGLGFLGVGALDGDDSEPWQTAYLILGSLLAGAAVAEMQLTLGADDLNPRLAQAVIFFAVAGLALAGALLKRIPVLLQLAGLAGLLGWVSLLGKVFSIDSSETYRTLIVIYAAVVLAAAIYLGRAGKPFAPDLVCVAGIALLVAASISLAGLVGAVTFNGVPGVQAGFPQPSEAWNVIVLLEALALIAYATRARTRGPGYVGALALVLFVGQAGIGVAELAKGQTPSHPGGWAIVLLIAGAAGVALGFARQGHPNG